MNNLLSPLLRIRLFFIRPMTLVKSLNYLHDDRPNDIFIEIALLLLLFLDFLSKITFWTVLHNYENSFAVLLVEVFFVADDVLMP